MIKYKPVDNNSAKNKGSEKTGTSLYIQVMRSILSTIKSGDLPFGAQLPTETEFCEDFQVSRITVRRALDILEMDGIIKREAGRGTFVAVSFQKNPDAVEKEFVTNIKSIITLGNKFDFFLKGIEVVNSPEEIKKELNEPIMVCVKGVRRKNSIRGYVKRYLGSSVLKDVPPMDLIHRPIIEFVEEKLQKKAYYAEQIISVVDGDTLDSEITDEIRLRWKNAPVFDIQTFHRSENKELMLLSINYLKPEEFKYLVRVPKN